MTTPPSQSAAGAPAGSPDPAAGCPVDHGAVAMFGPRFINDDRDELYRDMRRQHGAIAPVTLPGDVPAWLVLGYKELHHITENPALFTRDSSVWNMWDRIPPDWPLMPMVGRQPSILYEDGERHARRSALVSDALGEVDPFELRGYAEQNADALIDSFCRLAEADLISQYAKKLPALVLAKLYGFTDEEGAALVPSINAVVNGSADALQGRQHLQSSMGALLRSRAISPAADVSTRMQTHFNSGEFSSEEILEDMMVNIVAGHDPSADWIGNSMRLMLTDERFSASLSGGRNSVAEAMNEVLWEETPSQNIAGRWTTRDTHLAGKRIRCGDLLILSFAGANADPQIRPDRTAFTGGNSAFLSFGHGAHRCPYPAQEIAEGIARTGIEVLLDRLPDVDLAVPPEELRWRPSPFLRGLESLPVTFTPTSALGGGR
ncbi:cytochrome P450 [Streptomyces daqingensis]|uniref:Cytochrome P450 n=1 Tax=Streptomyces daqingensis TaxID=1472640 RepID=A0ABQ2LV64_9ACTN|nr:cytochrome P450 [Streptomyces daqingensis]GGO43621.1 cytochrome P450 [Streptomyces daqingensis]